MATSVAQYPQSAHQSSRNCGSSSSRSNKMVENHDPFYGHRAVSEMCESVITALFACPLDSTSSSIATSACATSRPPPRLAEFIGYALHRTRLPDEITFQALFLLRRLKSRFPAARGSSGHRLFISALMLASKSSCDDTYSNKSWTIVSQGLFSLREVNQMERELFGYLGFKVNVEIEELTLFTDMLVAGDLAAVVDLTTGMPCSPNPSSVSSPSIDRGCETPTTSIDTTPRKSVSSVESTASMARASSACRQYARASSLSSYVGDLHSTASSSMAAVSATSGKGSCAYVRSGSVSYDRHQPYQQHAAYPLASNGYPTNLSPSNVSTISSSRGSISSASGSSMTPSPSSLSHSEASSSRTSPDTPPSELCSSPWNSDGEVKSSVYSGEPAGSYDQAHLDFYQHLKASQQQQQYYAQHAYPVVGNTRVRQHFD